MKKSSLTTAVLAGLVGAVGFAGSASAVELNPDGTGEVLIYPYYTVNAGQQTLLSVVNSAGVGKAVKVRFLEGYNSREVLDFNLFLSPYDVWTATVADMATASGDPSQVGAGVATNDMSCTFPSFTGAGYVAFRNFAYTGDPASEPATEASDSGPTGLERTREGYVELITMGDIVNTPSPADLYDAVLHSSGVPSCAYPLDSVPVVAAELQPPTGGLFGTGYLVSVADGTMYAYEADAIGGFSQRQLFSIAGSLDPSLADANSNIAGDAIAYVFEDGVLTTATYDISHAIDAVSAVFMASSVLNEWVANEAGGIGTDWVLTFPTKRFYVDEAFTGGGFIQPFSEVFAGGASCAEVALTLPGTTVGSVFDREEGSGTPDPGGFSPRPPGNPASAICHEVNVITIGGTGSSDAPASVLGSSYDGLALNINQYGNAGWMRIDLNPSSEVHALRASDDAAPVTLFGLPTTGFAATRFINADVSAGVLANYSAAMHHRVERDLSVAP